MHLESWLRRKALDQDPQHRGLVALEDPQMQAVYILRTLTFHSPARKLPQGTGAQSLSWDFVIQHNRLS